MHNINEAQNNILAMQVPSSNAMREPLLTHGKVCPSVSYRRCYIIDKKIQDFEFLKTAASTQLILH